MMRNRLLGFCLGLTLVAAYSGIAVAQTRYAPPTLSLVDRGLYRITLGVTAGADGSPAGFTVQWMKKSDFDALGGWALDGDPRLKYCSCYGQYVLNDWAGSAIMGPGETSYLQLGDLADESPNALYGNEYIPLGDASGPPYRSLEYVIRAFTEGDGYGEASDFSNTLVTSTTASECTQGFWKTHGPGACHSGSNADVWPASCFPMELGTAGSYQYNQTEICSILNQNPAGNGLISLAHQLITTLLNGCSTSDLSPVSGTITAAKALIDNLVVPPVNGSTDFLSPASTSSLTETLDDYNNGLLGGVSNCPTPVHSNSTWGRIKVLYR